MPLPRRTLAAPALAAALLAVAPADHAAAAGPACPGADAIPTAHDLALVRRATLCLLNAERHRHGLGPLRSRARLRHTAEAYSRSMAGHHFFAHVSAVSGSTPMSRIAATRYLSGVRAWAIGENIAWGAGRLASPREVVGMWMHSPGHRANILSPRFREIGVGVATGAPVRLPAGLPAATYTTDFGARGR